MRRLPTKDVDDHRRKSKAQTPGSIFSLLSSATLKDASWQLYPRLSSAKKSSLLDLFGAHTAYIERSHLSHAH